MSSAKSIEERHFYLRLCAKEHYSKRKLERQIDSVYYERCMLSAQKPVPETASQNVRGSILDTYVLEFLDLPEQYSERNFKKAIIENLKQFILESLPQMDLHLEIGKLVSYRPERGGAVAAAEYLGKTYPDVSGFSLRNLRRMRDFYRAYHDTSEVLAEAMTIGWTENVVILEAELTLQERPWYIQAPRQFRWSKSMLIRMIQERAHETTTLDTATDPCYIGSTRGDEDGTKEPSRTFLQGLWDAGVQRELQRQGSRGSHLQSLFPPFASAAGGTGGAASIGKSSIAPPDRKRNDMAEKPDPRSPVQNEVLSLYGLCSKISSFGTKPEEAGTVHPNLGIKHRRRYRDSYDAQVYVKESYQVSRTPPAIIRIQ